MSDREVFSTKKSEETRFLGKLLAKELRGGKVICLKGELGSGKTTFAQGMLEGLGARGPYTSPTFVVLKHYKIKNQKSRIKSSARNFKIKPHKKQNTKHGIQNIYHLDAYRVCVQDIIDLGWKEIISEERNVVIVEWADRIRSIIPKNAIWLSFEHIKDNKREITVQ